MFLGVLSHYLIVTTFEVQVGVSGMKGLRFWGFRITHPGMLVAEAYMLRLSSMELLALLLSLEKLGHTMHGGFAFIGNRDFGISCCGMLR